MTACSNDWIRGLPFCQQPNDQESVILASIQGKFLILGSFPHELAEERVEWLVRRGAPVSVQPVGQWFVNKYLINPEITDEVSQMEQTSLNEEDEEVVEFDDETLDEISLEVDNSNDLDQTPAKPEEPNILEYQLICDQSLESPVIQTIDSGTESLGSGSPIAEEINEIKPEEFTETTQVKTTPIETQIQSDVDESSSRVNTPIHSVNEMKTCENKTEIGHVQENNKTGDTEKEKFKLKIVEEKEVDIKRDEIENPSDIIEEKPGDELDNLTEVDELIVQEIHDLWIELYNRLVQYSSFDNVSRETHREFHDFKSQISAKIISIEKKHPHLISTIQTRLYESIADTMNDEQRKIAWKYLIKMQKDVRP